MPQAVYKDTPKNRELGRVGKPFGDPQFKVSKSATKKAPATKKAEPNLKTILDNLNVSDLKSILKGGVVPGTNKSIGSNDKAIPYIKMLIQKKSTETKKAPAPKPKKPKITNPNKPITDKGEFLDILNISAQLGKSKEKSSNVEGKVEASKLKSRVNRVGGKISFKLFDEILDFEGNDAIGQLRDNIQEVQSYNMDYWLSRVSKTADTYNDLTDKQSDRLFNIMSADVDKEEKLYKKEFYEKKIKGKTHTYESLAKLIKDDYGEDI